MTGQLQQSVMNAAGSPQAVAGVSAATISAGVSTALSLLPPVLGIMASMCGIILSILLARNYIKRWQLMDIDLKLKEEELEQIGHRRTIVVDGKDRD